MGTMLKEWREGGVNNRWKGMRRDKTYGKEKRWDIRKGMEKK